MVDKKRKKQAGFTLVEVMVTMTIIALMVVIVGVNVIPMVGKSKVKKARIDIAALSQAIEYYHLDNDTYPENLEDLLNNQSGLSERTNPDGYIKILQDDPWGNAYLYEYPGQNGRFDIWSYGADGEEGGEGDNADITSWQK